jgi:hypothetical protein
MDGRSLRDFFPILPVSEQLIPRVAFAGPVASWRRPASNSLAVCSPASTSEVGTLAISGATRLRLSPSRNRGLSGNRTHGLPWQRRGGDAMSKMNG